MSRSIRLSKCSLVMTLTQPRDSCSFCSIYAPLISLIPASHISVQHRRTPAMVKNHLRCQYACNFKRIQLINHICIVCITSFQRVQSYFWISLVLLIHGHMPSSFVEYQINVFNMTWVRSIRSWSVCFRHIPHRFKCMSK